jgi:hypothetical protein
MMRAAPLRAVRLLAPSRVLCSRAASTPRVHSTAATASYTASPQGANPSLVRNTHLSGSASPVTHCTQTLDGALADVRAKTCGRSIASSSSPAPQLCLPGTTCRCMRTQPRVCSTLCARSRRRAKPRCVQWCSIPPLQIHTGGPLTAPLPSSYARPDGSCHRRGEDAHQAGHEEGQAEGLPVRMQT